MNKRECVIYLSGKYTGKTDDERDHNIAKAYNKACRLWDKGYTVICPHTNTMHMEKHTKLTYDDFMAGDYELVNRSDIVYMLDNWKDSKGAKLEHHHALSKGKYIAYNDEQLDIIYEFFLNDRINNDVIENILNRKSD